jgi:hypothetical protein
MEHSLIKKLMFGHVVRKSLPFMFVTMSTTANHWFPDESSPYTVIFAVTLAVKKPPHI